jgi:hypothetical protein
MARSRAMLVSSVVAGVCSLAALSGCATAGGSRAGEEVAATSVPAGPCGPQSPRDLALAGGVNEIPVPGDGTRPPRLCNVHFHRPAEHTGIAACPRVEEPPSVGVCGGHGEPPVRPGDEVEVHWVYTSCPPPPERRPGLDNCTCEAPVLMVIGQEYVVAPDGTAGADGALDEPAAGLARYGGSTTGPGFSGGKPGDDRPCSPARVQWAMARQCRELAVAALGAWCAGNEWGEDHAHGIRPVIGREDWLSPYVPGH